MKKILLIVLLLLCGCAVGHFTVPSKETLQKPFPPINKRAETTLVGSGLSSESLEKEGIAILALLKGGPQGLRLNMAFEIFQGLRFYFPNARVVPYRDTIQKIREARKFTRYQGFVKDYEIDRTMEAHQLRKWGEIAGVRYLFIAQIKSNDKHTTTRTMKLGEDSVNGQITASPSGPVHIPYTVEKKVVILGELWDSQCGQAVWIGTSWADVSEPAEAERVRVEDIFTSTTRHLIETVHQAMNKRRVSQMLPECASN